MATQLALGARLAGAGPGAVGAAVERADVDVGAVGRKRKRKWGPSKLGAWVEGRRQRRIDFVAANYFKTAYRAELHRAPFAAFLASLVAGRGPGSIALARRFGELLGEGTRAGAPAWLEAFLRDEPAWRPRLAAWVGALSAPVGPEPGRLAKGAGAGEVALDQRNELVAEERVRERPGSLDTCMVKHSIPLCSPGTPRDPRSRAPARLRARSVRLTPSRAAGSLSLRRSTSRSSPLAMSPASSCTTSSRRLFLGLSAAGTTDDVAGRLPSGGPAGFSARSGRESAPRPSHDDGCWHRESRLRARTGGAGRRRSSNGPRCKIGRN